MQLFTLYWKDGTKQLVVGNDIEHAFDRHHIPLFKLPDLNHSSATGDTHYWDTATSSWQEYSPNVTITEQVDQQATRTLALDQFYRTKQLTYQTDVVTLTLTRQYSKYAIIGPVVALELRYRNIETDRFSSDTIDFQQDYLGVLGFTDLMYGNPVNEAVSEAFTPVSDLKQVLLNPR